MMVGVPTRSGNRLCFPWATADTSMYRAYQWNILEAFRAQSIYLYVNPRKSVFLGYELKLLISTAGGRFHFITVQGRHLFKETTFIVSTLPRAWLEPRANRMLVMKALRQIISVGRVTTVPGRRELSLPSP